MLAAASLILTAAPSAGRAEGNLALDRYAIVADPGQASFVQYAVEELTGRPPGIPAIQAIANLVATALGLDPGVARALRQQLVATERSRRAAARKARERAREIQQAEERRLSEWEGELVGIDAAQLRLDDQNQASGQQVQATADAVIGATTISVNALQYPMLSGSLLVFSDASMESPVEVTLNAAAAANATRRRPPPPRPYRSIPRSAPG